jgi:hypothetical protein
VPSSQRSLSARDHHREDGEKGATRRRQSDACTPTTRKGDTDSRTAGVKCPRSSDATCWRRGSARAVPPRSAAPCAVGDGCPRALRCTSGNEQAPLAKWSLQCGDLTSPASLVELMSRHSRAFLLSCPSSSMPVYETCHPLCPSQTPPGTSGSGSPTAMPIRAMMRGLVGGTTHRTASRTPNGTPLWLIRKGATSQVKSTMAAAPVPLTVA